MKIHIVLNSINSQAINQNLQIKVKIKKQSLHLSFIIYILFPFLKKLLKK